MPVTVHHIVVDARSLRLFEVELRVLIADPSLANITFFRNRGALAGATLAHPHSQVIATALVPTDVARKAAQALSYFDFRGRCAWCDAIAQETADVTRIVAANDRFVAFAPFASRIAYELCIVPLAHDSVPADLDRPAIEALAAIVRDCARRLAALLGAALAYNLVVHAAPRAQAELAAAYHWHVEIVPRLSAVPAGF